MAPAKQNRRAGKPKKKLSKSKKSLVPRVHWKSPGFSAFCVRCRAYITFRNIVSRLVRHFFSAKFSHSTIIANRFAVRERSKEQKVGQLRRDGIARAWNPLPRMGKFYVTCLHSATNASGRKSVGSAQELFLPPPEPLFRHTANSCCSVKQEKAMILNIPFERKAFSALRFLIRREFLSRLCSGIVYSQQNRLHLRQLETTPSSFEF